MADDDQSDQSACFDVSCILILLTYTVPLCRSREHSFSNGIDEVFTSSLPILTFGIVLIVLGLFNRAICLVFTGKEDRNERLFIHCIDTNVSSPSAITFSRPRHIYSLSYALTWQTCP
jgi:hypothetical protein